MNENKNRNPLLSLRTYTIKNILVAFTTTEDALNTPIDIQGGKCGDSVKGNSCGKNGIVVINEFYDDKFYILNHTNEFSFELNNDFNTSVTTGTLSIVDRVSGYFQDFLKNDVADKLGVAETHLIFSLRTYITGTTYDDKREHILIKPLIFHALNLSHGFSDSSAQNMYILTYAADYNAYGILPNYTNSYQMTVTHKDNGKSLSGVSSSKINSKIDSTLGLSSKTSKDKLREEKNNKEHVMYNLGDVMAGLEYELKNQKFAPKSKLQDFLSNIRDDYIHRIEPYKQKKDNGVLPIEYNIKLDDKYKNYVVDNRNLYFEQTDESQTSGGIKYYSIKPGKHIIKTITNLMKLSSQVGKEANETPSKFFKPNISTIKTCDDNYQFNVGIKKYTVPRNDGVVETGPTEYSVKPLTFDYQKSAQDRDILSLHASLNSDTGLSILEVVNNNDNSRIVLGNREQITNERNANVNFFKTSYSGIRTMTSKYNYFLEKPEASANIENIAKTNLIQTSKLELIIVGNPNLLSDLFRNPLSVANENDDSPYYYKFPEFHPMYVRLNIYLKPSDTLGIKLNKDVPSKYYYNGYYHLGKVVSEIEGSLFRQKLVLYRTDLST